MKRKLLLGCTFFYTLVFVMTSVFGVARPAYAAGRLSDADVKGATMTWINRAQIEVKVGSQTLQFVDKDIGSDNNFKVQNYECPGQITFDPSDDHSISAKDKVTLDLDILPAGGAGNHCVDTSENKIGGFSVASPDQGNIYYYFTDPNTIARVDGNTDWQFTENTNEGFSDLYMRTAEDGKACQDRILVNRGASTMKMYEMTDDNRGNRFTDPALGLTGENCYPADGVSSAIDSAKAYPIRNSTDKETSSVVTPANTNLSGNDAPTCETTGGNPLSFIICPIINSVSSLADWVLGSVIQPFLDRIPLSTDAGDPAFQAWSSFRAIANILLILVLVVVVIAQAMGGE